MLQREIPLRGTGVESMDWQIDRLVSPPPPTGMLREGRCRAAAAAKGVPHEATPLCLFAKNHLSLITGDRYGF
jgi:hypothetical protein